MTQSQIEIEYIEKNRKLQATRVNSSSSSTEFDYNSFINIQKKHQSDDREEDRPH